MKRTVFGCLQRTNFYFDEARQKFRSVTFFPSSYLTNIRQLTNVRTTVTLRVIHRYDTL